nr:MAG: hypothetical protein [Metapenaeopsis lamellata majanivirus]
MDFKIFTTFCEKIEEMIYKTVPVHLQGAVKILIDNCVRDEEAMYIKTEKEKIKEEALPDKNDNEEELMWDEMLLAEIPVKCNSGLPDMDDVFQELHKQIEVQKKALLNAIARLVLEIWSPKMKTYAERVILKKAIDFNYLREDQIKFVTIFSNYNEDHIPEAANWIIKQDDQLIIDLLWMVFNLKQHFYNVHSNRMQVIKIANALNEKWEGLQEKIIERHDLTKYALNQAMGYTLGEVHNKKHDIWEKACNLHVNNEPHHPEMWSNVHTADEKRKKLKHWIQDECYDKLDSSTLSQMDLESEKMVSPFLLEVFLDLYSSVENFLY